jgi:hypothetical protein
MDGRRGPFHAAIPLGSWLGVRVQLSVWFPVLTLIFCYRFGLERGLLLTVLLLASVLLHEMFHALAARWTGGSWMKSCCGPPVVSPSPVRIRTSARSS